PQTADDSLLQTSIQEYLASRGEPASYLHVHTAGLIALAEANALKQPEHEFDEALRKTNALFESALKTDERFVHYSTGENVETGTWSLHFGGGAQAKSESLSDQVEVAIVTFLQKNQHAIYLEVEDELYPRFTGLLTPSKGLIYAVLNSYAEKESGGWKLRAEDLASARRSELNDIFALIEAIGRRLEYKTNRTDKTLTWLENGKPIRSFYVMASALFGRALETTAPDTILVIPGGRAALAAYKLQRDPALAAQLKTRRVVKYRLLRAILEVPILTRDSFEEQIASDPVEKSAGQMMMF
ncbi:MAG TPA: hypothetical protein PLF18_05290, partial [Anaerolineales bacterium]|nr:hypothetical protein [Anaerolineales bacterium]